MLLADRALHSGNIVRASDSLTTITGGASAASRSSKGRPSTSGDAHDVEVAGPDRQIERERLVAGRRRRPIGRREAARAAHVAHRRVCAGRCLPHTGQRAELVDHAVDEPHAILRLRIVRVRQHDAERQHAFGAEARIHGCQARRAPDHQAADDQQHERRCDLADDQRLPQPQHAVPAGLPKRAEQASRPCARPARSPRREPGERGADRQHQHREQRKRRPPQRPRRSRADSRTRRAISTRCSATPSSAATAPPATVSVRCSTIS